MRAEDILKGMPDGDWNQRYRETYIHYNGQVQYVTNFERPYIGFLRTSVEYDWKLHNTHRPRSRWYVLGDIAPFFLSYIPQRQFRRGFCRANTSVYSPFGNVGLDEHALNVAYQDEDSTVPKLSSAEVVEQAVKKRFALLSPYMGIFNLNLMYKMCNIGEFDGKKIYLNDPQFKDEMNDLGLLGITELVRPPVNSIPVAKAKKIKSEFPLQWNIGEVRRG